MHSSLRTFTRRFTHLFTRYSLFTRCSLGVSGGVGGGLGVGVGRGVAVAVICLLFSTISLFAQNPIKWSFTAKDAGNCQVDLIFTGVLEEGWCTYSQFLESEDGPVATSITFMENPGFKLIGKAKESGEIIKTHDAIFNMNLTKFKHKAILTQRVEVKDPSKPIVGYVNYMTCNDEMCLPPKDADFSIKIPVLKGCSAKTSND